MKPTNITVIIPVFNIARRGYNRLKHSLYSLSKQDCTVIVSCGSWDAEYNRIKNICTDFNVMCIYTPMPKFNKPILLNRGITQVKDGYVMCTDVDYIFGKDFIECLKKNAKSDRFICKEVMMLPQQELSYKIIDAGKYKDPYPNKYGRVADGACQFASLEWFKSCGGYDERMFGWCAMDNDMTKRADLRGMEMMWMKESVIYHQWHTIEKYRKARDIHQSKLNHKILKNDNSIIRNQKT